MIYFSVLSGMICTSFLSWIVYIIISLIISFSISSTNIMIIIIIVNIVLQQNPSVNRTHLKVEERLLTEATLTTCPPFKESAHLVPLCPRHRPLMPCFSLVLRKNGASSWPWSGAQTGSPQWLSTSRCVESITFTLNNRVSHLCS